MKITTAAMYRNFREDLFLRREMGRTSRRRRRGQRWANANLLVQAVYGRPNYQNGYKPKHREHFVDIDTCFPRTAA